MTRDWEVVYAEYAPGFQEYVYTNGKRVPQWEPVGIENEELDLLILLPDIMFDNEAWNDE